MKIINLQAENFKRIQAVDITPKDNLVVLSGANEQGKSSVLDAIMAAISGGRGIRDISEPIRKGQERAEVKLDLGDLKIRRVWQDGKTPRIEVTSADGKKYPSPQAMLDTLTGTLTFDPLEFARMPPREQRATLLRLVELPFDPDENDAERTVLVQKETAAKQEAKRLDQSVSALTQVPIDTPDEEISAAEIYEELTKAQAVVDENKRKRSELEEAKNAYRQANEGIKDIKRHIDELKKELENMEAALVSKREIGERLKTEVDALIDPDTSELKAKLASLDKINRNVRQKQSNEQTLENYKAAQILETAAKKAVAAHDKARAKALAEAKFPVDGLAFSQDGVTLNDLPFAQASESQRIMTSAAMGMAMNPELKVMFIRDGSMLDSKRMEALSKMAEEHEFQIWIERVDESGAVGIVIEDGLIQEKKHASRSLD